MGFRERIKKINVKGIWERNAFYILLAICIVVMGAVAWTSRSHQEPAPQAPPAEEKAVVTPLPELEIERREYTLQTFPEADQDQDTADNEEPTEPEEVTSVNTEAPVVADAGTAAEEAPPADTAVSQEEEADEPAVQTAAQVTAWQNPLPGIIVTRYAADQLVYWETLGAWRVHAAIDIKPERDTAVCAAAAGTVSLVIEDDMLGYMIVIDHEGGFQTCYASLADDIPVEAGYPVLAGQQIGTAGDTARSERAHGVHLHFAVWQDGQSVDPLSYISIP